MLQPLMQTRGDLGTWVRLQLTSIVTPRPRGTRMPSRTYSSVCTRGPCHGDCPNSPMAHRDHTMSSKTRS